MKKINYTKYFETEKESEEYIKKWNFSILKTLPDFKSDKVWKIVSPKRLDTGEILLIIK